MNIVDLSVFLRPLVEGGPHRGGGAGVGDHLLEQDDLLAEHS